MKKMTIVLTMIAMAALTAGVIAADTDASNEDPPGRIVAARGNLETLSGTLRWERDEWYLSTGPGTLYELHLGPYGHREEPIFTAGASAATEGFVYGNHVAPVTVDTMGETHRFWTSDRMPLWAGSGEGGGRVAQTSPEIPLGQRLAQQQEDQAGPGQPPGEQVGPRSFSGEGDGVGTRGAPAEEVQRGFRNEPAGGGRFRN
ncbi:MAG: hypothetical protein EA427_04525 [Spirochaetaceae bacterium]|nr:MAG: hypothetical protein EA427_04525 [Spirochaetaceae bacterium]